MTIKKIKGKFNDCWNSTRNYVVLHLIKIIPYLPLLIISILLAIAFFCISDYHLLVSVRNIYVPILIFVIVVYGFLQSKNSHIIKKIPKFRAFVLLVALLGIYLVPLNNRIEYIKPIYSASGTLALKIEPTKLKEFKFSKNFYGFVKLVTNRRGYLFLVVGEMVDFGNNGLISTLSFDLGLNPVFPFHSSLFFDSLPYNNIKEYDSFNVLLPMLMDIQILEGKLTINVNNDKILKFDVPRQKLNDEERYLQLIIPIKK